MSSKTKALGSKREPSLSLYWDCLKIKACDHLSYIKSNKCWLSSLKRGYFAEKTLVSNRHKEPEYSEISAKDWYQKGALAALLSFQVSLLFLFFPADQLFLSLSLHGG